MPFTLDWEQDKDVYSQILFNMLARGVKQYVHKRLRGWKEISTIIFNHRWYDHPCKKSKGIYKKTSRISLAR